MVIFLGTCKTDVFKCMQTLNEGYQKEGVRVYFHQDFLKIGDQSTKCFGE